MPMNLIADIRKYWGWTGLNPVEIVRENDFGNIMVKDAEGKYWRLAPEDCSCNIVANNRHELDALAIDQEFLHDWNMRALVEMAVEKCGPLTEGRKYCLKIPGILGGEYGGSNLATISLAELIRSSGDIARRVENLPDGAVVSLEVVG